MGILIISIPLTVSISMILFGRYIGIKGGRVLAIINLIISNMMGIILLLGHLSGIVKVIDIKDWFNIGVYRGIIGLIFDKESLIMINLIIMVSTIVIIYSYWYLGHDSHLNRFIGKLILFSVTMLIFVSADNLLFAFLGWESVGILSFLLINFWSERSPDNSKSALKAIIFNRVGDVFYLLALILLSTFNPSFSYSISFLETDSFTILNLLTLCLILAAMAKSAQILLHPWLGDAMAGPTPVSALLHAATMVTAGIFLILRNKGLLFDCGHNVRELLFIVGSITILFAGITAINLFDLKKIIAFSTCGQIGYMLFALPLFYPTHGSLFHLLTHGSFKALLFLCAGILIHSYSNEQDLRKFGNSLFQFPLLFLFFLVASLALIPFPGFSGFLSKESILVHSFDLPFFYFFVLSLGSLLSSIYSFKLLYFSFFSTPSISPSYTPLSYSPYLIPLLFLFLGSIFLGSFSSPLLSSIESINSNLHSTPNPFLSLPIVLPILALLLLLVNSYIPSYPWSSSRYFTIVGSSKFFFDSIYNYFLLLPLFSTSYHFSLKFIDRGFLEFLGPINLFRLFFFFPSSFSLSSQSLSNLPFIFFYLFLSFIILLSPFFLPL